jgi:hypothetical protein
VHTALRATSITLSDFVRREFVADAALGAFFDPVLGGTMVVTHNNPEEMRANNIQGLSVWLYRVERDDQLLNAPPTRPQPNRLLPTPLPLRLHYLLTPVVTIDPAFPAVSPGLEQELLGKVLQQLYQHPVLRGVDLRDTLTGSEQRLTLRLEPMSLEEITRVWHALQRPYQLSLSYEVTLALIAPETQPSVSSPVTIAEPKYSVIVSKELP